MGRLDRRIRRLEQHVKGRHATSWQARIARMSCQELKAEIVRMGAEQGYPGDPTVADMGAVLQWLHEQILAAVDGLPDEEQAEWRAQLEGLAAVAIGSW